MNNEMYKEVTVGDVFNVFKGYSETKLNEKVIKQPDLNYNTCKLIRPDDIEQYVSYTKNKDVKYKEFLICNIYKKQYKIMERGDIIFPVVSPLGDIQIYYIDKEPNEVYLYNEGLIVLKPKNTNLNTKAIWILLTKTNLKEDIIKLKYNIAKSNRFKQKENRIKPRLTTKLISEIRCNMYSNTEMNSIVKKYNEFETKYNEFLHYLDKFIV